MANFKIVKLEDTSECEDCGVNYADGFIVYKDGVEVLNLEPVAHCYSGASYNEYDFISKLLEYLGHTCEFEF